MNIQKKTSIILFTVIFLYATTLILLTNHFWNIELKKFDKEEALKNNSVLKNYLNKELISLSLLLKDYARWDDTYIYSKEKNSSYIKDNYLGVDLDNFSYVSVFSKDGKLLSSFEILQDGTLKPWIFLNKNISTDSIWYKGTIENIKNGFIKINNSIFLIATAPILKNNTSENPNGILIFAKKFSNDIMLKIKKETQINLDPMSRTIKKRV